MFTPCCRASDTTGRPDDNVCSTLCRFCSAVQYRRRSDPPSSRSTPSTIRAIPWARANSNRAWTPQRHQTRKSEREACRQGDAFAFFSVRSRHNRFTHLLVRIGYGKAVTTILAGNPYSNHVSFNHLTLDSGTIGVAQGSAVTPLRLYCNQHWLAR
jgi:hypothetical protein